MSKVGTLHYEHVAVATAHVDTPLVSARVIESDLGFSSWKSVNARGYAYLHPPMIRECRESECRRLAIVDA